MEVEEWKSRMAGGRSSDEDSRTAHSWSGGNREESSSAPPTPAGASLPFKASSSTTQTRFNFYTSSDDLVSSNEGIEHPLTTIGSPEAQDILRSLQETELSIKTSNSASSAGTNNRHRAKDDILINSSGSVDEKVLRPLKMTEKSQRSKPPQNKTPSLPPGGKQTSLSNFEESSPAEIEAARLKPPPSTLPPSKMHNPASPTEKMLIVHHQKDPLIRREEDLEPLLRRTENELAFRSVSEDELLRSNNRIDHLADGMRGHSPYEDAVRHALQWLRYRLDPPSSNNSTAIKPIPRTPPKEQSEGKKADMIMLQRSPEVEHSEDVEAVTREVGQLYLEDRGTHEIPGASSCHPNPPQDIRISSDLILAKNHANNTPSGHNLSPPKQYMRSESDQQTPVTSHRLHRKPENSGLARDERSDDVLRGVEKVLIAILEHGKMERDRDHVMKARGASFDDENDAKDDVVVAALESLVLLNECKALLRDDNVDDLHYGDNREGSTNKAAPYALFKHDEIVSSAIDSPGIASSVDASDQVLVSGGTRRSVVDELLAEDDEGPISEAKLDALRTELEHSDEQSPDPPAPKAHLDFETPSSMKVETDKSPRSNLDRSKFSVQHESPASLFPYSSAKDGMIGVEAVHKIRFYSSPSPTATSTNACSNGTDEVVNNKLIDENQDESEDGDDSDYEDESYDSEDDSEAGDDDRTNDEYESTEVDDSESGQTDESDMDSSTRDIDSSIRDSDTNKKLQAPNSPSIIESLSSFAQAPSFMSLLSYPQSHDGSLIKDKYSTEGDEADIAEEEQYEHEINELMVALCSHLLPPGYEKDPPPRNLSPSMFSRKRKDFPPKFPFWDEQNPDELGHLVHRLSQSQVHAIDAAFERAMGKIKYEEAQKSKEMHRVDDAELERDLKEVEDLLQEEEKRSEHEKRPETQKAVPQEQTVDEEPLVVDPVTLAIREHFPGVKPSGKGEIGDLEFFTLPIIFKSHVTGFEPTKDLVLEPGNIVGGQYLVESELGSAAFSTAYRCIDLSSDTAYDDGDEHYHEEVCLKVIKNTKDFFDQSLDEIKILELLRQTKKCHQNYIVEMKTFFYHREHLIIVTELLRQNLFEFGKFIMDNDEEPYFTIPRLSYITRQVLIALNFVHKLGLVHSDVKPENILLSSYSRAQVKLIDFGSSCFLTDRQSSYIQSRSYRAPEVVLGLPYSGKIDVWSLGCVVAEMFTGEVTFQNDSIVSMLSRMEAICGPFPPHMIANGRHGRNFFTKSGLVYEIAETGKTDTSALKTTASNASSLDGYDGHSARVMHYDIFQPKVTTLPARLGLDPELLEKGKASENNPKYLFADFVRTVLTIDPDKRPSAEEALEHPWIKWGETIPEEDIKYLS